jgi:hypothetical protein
MVWVIGFAEIGPKKLIKLPQKEFIVGPRLLSAAQTLAFSFGLDLWPGQLYRDQIAVVHLS